MVRGNQEPICRCLIYSDNERKYWVGKKVGRENSVHPAVPCRLGVLGVEVATGFVYDVLDGLQPNLSEPPPYYRGLSAGLGKGPDGGRLVGEVALSSILSRRLVCSLSLSRLPR